MLYKMTYEGVLECTLEVFDREKKLGYTMVAWPARMRYEARRNCYMARYLSGSTIMTEMISVQEEHRLRFCPISMTKRLQSKAMQLCFMSENAIREAQRFNFYPYRVLEGFCGLEVGQDVELQWKMQENSPFGWWHAHLEALRKDPDGKQATAILTFKHFAPNSRWHRMEVRFGGSEMQTGLLGGFTGGLRPVSAEDAAQWKRFFPKELLV